MTLPNFYIIGAPKCGTTSMHYWLSQHPNIFMSNPKEPHFWNDDMNNYPKMSFDNYQKLFKDVKNEKIIGEASTWYLYSDKAVSNIEKSKKKSLPKYLVMVRNPIDMFKSLYKHNFRRFHEDITNIEEAWFAQKSRKKGLNIPKHCSDWRYLNYGEVCKLGEQINKIYSIVPKKRVKIIVFDDLKEDNMRAYNDVLEFLEIDKTNNINFDIKNKGGQIKSAKFNKIGLYAKKIKNKLGIQKNYGIISKILQLNTKNKKYQININNTFRKELEKYFEEDVKNLSNILDRDLSYWIKKN